MTAVDSIEYTMFRYGTDEVENTLKQTMQRNGECEFLTFFIGLLLSLAIQPMQI